MVWKIKQTREVQNEEKGSQHIFQTLNFSRKKGKEKKTKLFKTQESFCAQKRKDTHINTLTHYCECDDDEGRV